MDLFNVIITPRAKSMLDQLVCYLEVKKQSPQSADNVFIDALETGDQLKTLADSFGYCDDSDLKRMGFRKLKFIHHDYILIYRVDGINAVVEAFYHQSQDYEHVFSKDIGIV
ncbi:type II toxin-antitoxin system RelE/ParE family toxin [Oribacterium sp. NK2B42]|uniref:type II toxin-antitoxin system RelE/ParE family toxin n=1 Tax=Oribacterium sp. NK2B42 TaxID=689781 RepID=UPI0004927276|nr:type II toxin-antitoxin system RelE/ParE family toxin [Oribacterium sp. NK2B42]